MRNITLNHITKIEGHARLDLKIDRGHVVQCELGSVEGSRYFEGLIKGRRYREAPEITMRVCGICSSAHGVASILAMENTLGIKPTEQTLALRTLQTIGERIRSHATHLYFLSLPDYLGYESALQMTGKYRAEIGRALRLMKLGNDMVTLVTGRVIHPISPTIGGFLHLPADDDLSNVRQRLDSAHQDILDTCKLFSTLDYPDFSRKTQYLSIINDLEFGTSAGRMKIGDQVFEQKDFHRFIGEYHEPYSTANFVVRENKSYSVGAMARFNNNMDKLGPETRSYMKELDISFPSHNPFHNTIAQALELIHYRGECMKLLDRIEIEQEEPVKAEVKAGHGIAANEAPRGTLWHEYKVNNKGMITYANIVTPTAQFLRNLNEDIAAYVQQLLDNGAGKRKLVLEIEKLIRSYDPCFSCASHFLDVRWL
ncbi:MAG: Ni/Fe hydrogenase subunit alpha [archaeon]